jgi:hypothetical protein
MTALCGGGPSQAIDPQKLFVNLTAAGIIEILTTGEWGFMAAVASGVGYLAFDLLGLCSTDPPALPTIDAQRLFDYTDPHFQNGPALLGQDVTALISNFLWRQYCECVTGPQPAPVPPGTPPAGQQTNPNLLTTTAPPGFCASRQWADTTAIAANGTFSQTPLSAQNWGVLPQWAYFVHNTGIVGASGGYPITMTLEWLTGVGGTIIDRTVLTEAASQPSSTPYVDQFLVPAGAQFVNMVGQTTLTQAATLQQNQFLTLYCTAPPPATQEPCCPPDPTLENLVIQVLQLEQLILNSLGAKPQYTRGTVHSGLTGTGTISVSGLFGVLIELTSGVPTSPLLPGVPPYQFSVGWVSCLTGDGMIDEIRITRQAQVWGSRLAPYATEFGYQLNTGFTMNLTELVPG